MRITTPFTIDGQMRVKVVRDLVLTSKGIKFALVCLRRDAYSTTI